MTADAVAARPGEPAPGPGRPRDPQVDRAVLDAALAILAEGGVEALTMDAVACRAGVSRASVYRRHANRVDLMEAAFHAAASPKPDPPDTGAIRADLIELMDRLQATLSGSDGGRMLPVMLGAARENSEVREALDRFTASRRSPTVDVVRRAQLRGEIRDDVDPGMVTDLLVGAVIYRELLRSGGTGPGTIEALVDGVLDGVSA